MISFLYPWDSMTLRVDLKDPEFGDHQDQGLATETYLMMDGSLRTNIKRSSTILELEFVDVPREKAIEFRDFLVTSLGTKVRYVDYNSVHWVGFIKADPDLITTGRGYGVSTRKEGCSFKVIFEGGKL
jgi:hypothetical protein